VSPLPSCFLPSRAAGYALLELQLRQTSSRRACQCEYRTAVASRKRACHAADKRGVGHPSPSEAICAGGVGGVHGVHGAHCGAASTQTRGSAGRWKRWRADPCCASHALRAAEGKHGRRRELLRAVGAPWARHCNCDGRA
jgi:hypothetical protein